MNEKTRILLIDGERAFREQISQILSPEEYEIKECSGVIEAKKEISAFPPQLILMELEFFDGDGFRLCREIRDQSDIPVVICSYRDTAYDMVLALDLGADDYVVKPFIPEVLQARIRRLLKRCYPSLPAANPGDKCVQYPELVINLTNYMVTCQGKIIEMPPKELELLFFLASSPNQVFTREQLLDHIWGYDYEGDTRTVDVHIKRLREKLPSSSKWMLATVWGVGYKFEVKEL